MSISSQLIEPVYIAHCTKMSVLLLMSFACLSILSMAQFPVTDGVNDLFAVLTQCPISPRYPSKNQYFCYRTNMRMISGFTLCDPVFVRRRNLSILDRSDTSILYFLNTPGRLRGANHVNRLMCRWHIRCPAGQLMYYNIPEHQLQDPVVSPFFRDPICLDYLRISRDFGNQFTCGTLTPQGDLEPSRLLVEFRSNKSIRRPGFRMHVVCFDPKSQDVDGCTTTTSKRDANEHDIFVQEVSHQRIEEVMATMHKNKRSQPKSRFEQVNIDREAIVVYSRKTVIVFKDDYVLFTFNDVTSFHSYNEFEGVTSFYDIVNQTKQFRGFGVLTIVDETTYYVIFGVDPRFLPNTQERKMISTLLNAQEVVVANDDDPIPEEQRRQDPPRPSWKRQVSGQTNNISPGAVATAQSVNNSCNAVLKAVAQALLKNAGV